MQHPIVRVTSFEIVGAFKLRVEFDDGSAQVIDVRPSMSYRKGHIRQALWSIRPRLSAAAADRTKPVVLVLSAVAAALVVVKAL